ncbi:hypothetical protein Tco_1274386 [Tanacetum coccineum]
MAWIMKVEESCEDEMKGLSKGDNEGFWSASSLQGGDGGACKVVRWLLVYTSYTRDEVHISMVSISAEGFLPSIFLLVVIIVTVVIVVVTVILVVALVAIIGVVIVVTIIGVVVVMIIGVVVVVMIIGVVVVVVVSSIIKLSFVIIGSLFSIVLCYLIHYPLGYGNGFLQSLRL